MKRLWVTLSIAGLVACGGQDTADTGAGGTEGAATPPVSAESGAAPAAPSAAESAKAPAAAPEADAQGQQCLDLVEKAQFQAAIPVCLAALESNPASQEIKSALSRAQAETAKLADAAAATAESAKAGAEAAAGAAMDEATGEASGAVGDATGKASGAMDEATQGMKPKL